MLPSRNTIPQSAIGIDNNVNLITLHVYKERTDALDLRSQNSCPIFSDGGSKHIGIQLHEMPVQKADITSKNRLKMH